MHCGWMQTSRARRDRRHWNHRGAMRYICEEKRRTMGICSYNSGPSSLSLLSLRNLLTQDTFKSGVPSFFWCTGSSDPPPIQIYHFQINIQARWRRLDWCNAWAWYTNHREKRGSWISWLFLTILFWYLTIGVEWRHISPRRNNFACLIRGFCYNCTYNAVILPWWIRSIYL